MWQNHPKPLAKWTQKGEYGANHGLRTVTLGGVRGCELNANNAIFDTQHNHHLHITVSRLKLPPGDAFGNYIAAYFAEYFDKIMFLYINSGE